jgi:hypothetical protein
MRADVTAAGVDVKNCRVSGAGLKGARAGEVGEVVATLLDEFGNRTDGLVAMSIQQVGKQESRTILPAVYNSGCATFRCNALVFDRDA